MGKLSSQTQRQLKALSQNRHGQIVLAGLAVGLFYFPFWIQDLIVRSLSGSTGLVLILSTALLAIIPLFRSRQKLRQLQASEADQLIGRALILGSAALFPFVRTALWSQALIWLFTLFGIALSTWGIMFFKQYPLTTFLMPLTVYTRPGILAQGLWNVVIPPHLLENAMAAASVQGLQWIGQSATVEGGRFITLSDSTVEVAWRCNGFNMAVAMAITGMLLGIFFKRNWQKILGLMATGIVVGLTFNVPRVMLMALAAAYWGEKWFNFWHGSWGAQIFVGFLFTAYYYIAMMLIQNAPSSSSAPTSH